MALLNYAKTYDEIKHALDFKPYETGSNGGNGGNIVTGDFAKIFFSGEGDIITHGVNFTPVFKGGAKGLVPQSAQNGTRVNFLANDGTWKELTLAMLPMAASINDFSEDTLFTSKQIHDHFQSQLSAVDAMRFVGTIDPKNASAFPTKDGKIICEKGDTYRVSQSGTYAGFTLQAGDLLICVKDSPAGATASDIANELNEYWTVVESNINGSKTHYINNTKVEVFTNDLGTDPVNIWAPKTAGLTGQVLVSRGQLEDDPTPHWVNQSELIAGDLVETQKDKIVSSLYIDADGYIHTTSLSGKASTNTNAVSGNWNISIKGTAGKVANDLTLGTGLAFNGGTTYNGEAARQLMLVAATGGVDGVIGGVIVDGVAAGTNGKVESNEYKSTISVTTEGNIFLTPQNIINALGYKPGATENVINYSYFFAEDGSDKVGLASAKTNPFFNMTGYNAESGDTTIASSVQFSGQNGITVKATGKGAILFDLEQATDSVRGGIKIGYESANKKYAVQLDADGKAFVDVPWEDTSKAFSHIKVGSTTISADQLESTFELVAGNGVTLTASGNKINIDATTYNIVSASEAGLAPKMEASNATITEAFYVLSYSGTNAAAWNKLPATAFSDTWRNILVGGTEKLGTAVGKGLNFTGTGKTSVSFATGTADYDNIVIESTWRDVKVDGQVINSDHAFEVKTSEDIVVTLHEDEANNVSSVEFEILWYNISTKDKETVQ